VLYEVLEKKEGKQTKSHKSFFLGKNKKGKNKSQNKLEIK